MSFIPFQVSSNNDFDAAPSVAGEKLVVVSSSNAANDRDGVVLVGNIAGPSSTSETRGLATNSMIERETSATLISLAAMTAVTTPLTGVISIYGQGVAAEGDIQVTEVPLDGATLEIGLAGYTQTYTFRCPAAFTITTVAASSLADSDYFDIAIGATTYRFWFEIDGAGGVAPSNPGVLTKVSILSTDTAADVATTLEVAMESAITGWTCSASSDVITAVKDVLGTATLTFTDGTAGAATGFTYSEAGELGEGTADAANQIRTGFGVATGAAATTAEVALWIQYAMNASGGTAGTQYGTGTSAHAYLSASNTNSVTTITDRIACRRQLGWSSVAGTGLTVRDPTGGAYGTLLGQISGSTGITTGQIFNTPDLSDPTLIGLFASSTDAIQVQGRQATLRLEIANVSSAVIVKLQASDDGTTYYDVSGNTANLAGTVSGTSGAYVVTGSGTVFDYELVVGDKVIIAGYVYEVASITSSTEFITKTPLATSPSGATFKKQRWMQIGSLYDGLNQLIPIPQCEYCRLYIVTNANTASTNLHAGLII